ERGAIGAFRMSEMMRGAFRFAQFFVRRKLMALHERMIVTLRGVIQAVQRLIEIADGVVPVACIGIHETETIKGVGFEFLILQLLSEVELLAEGGLRLRDVTRAAT